MTGASSSQGSSFEWVGPQRAPGKAHKYRYEPPRGPRAATIAVYGEAVPGPQSLGAQVKGSAPSAVPPAHNRLL